MSNLSFFGNDGEIHVDRATGIVLEHAPEPFDSETTGYDHIAKVDLEERKRWYADTKDAIGDVQPDGDILDVGYWTKDEQYEAPCIDWRIDRLKDLGLWSC